MQWSCGQFLRLHVHVMNEMPEARESLDIQEEVCCYMMLKAERSSQRNVRSSGGLAQSIMPASMFESVTGLQGSEDGVHHSNRDSQNSIPISRCAGTGIQTFRLGVPSAALLSGVGSLGFGV